MYLRSENYWQAVETCQKVNGSLATFVTNEELQFILKIEVDFDDKVCDRRDQCKLVWVESAEESPAVWSCSQLILTCNLQVLGGLPVRDHQSEPFPGGSLGGRIPG